MMRRRPGKVRGGGSRRSCSVIQRCEVAGLLALPVAWLVVLYLGSLFVLLLAAFWDTEPFTSEVVHTWNLDNFKRILEEPVYRDVALRTVVMASAVTLADAVLAFPTGVLHGADRHATHTEPARRRGAHAAVGELSGQGVHLADDAR